VGCYKEATRLKQSVATEKDILAKARSLFKEDPDNKKKIMFDMEMHWCYLKDEPKWKDEIQTTSKRTKTSAGRAYYSSSNPETPTSDFNTPLPTTTRPIGRKAAKRKGKEKLVESFTGLEEAYKARTEVMVKIASVKEIEATAKLEEIKRNDIAMKHIYNGCPPTSNP
jgi:hypothetical protein